MISVNNADLHFQMVSNNEIRDSLILKKITTQEELKSKQLSEKIQPGLALDVFLHDDNEMYYSSFKRRRSKRLVELNKKFSDTKTNGKVVRPYLKIYIYKLHDNLNKLGCSIRYG